MLLKNNTDDQNIVKIESNPDSLNMANVKTATGYNSSLLAEAIKNQLDLLLEEDKPKTFEAESMMKQKTKVKERDLKKPVYDCPKCHYKSTMMSTLNRHIKGHDNERPFSCYICKKGFQTQRIQMNHENRHLGIRPYQCKTCSSKFTTGGELFRHTQYKHSNEKAYHCTECDYKCVEKVKFDRHMRIHTGERPEQCQDCSYAASNKFSLKRHIRTHTGEKPYMCEKCDKTFTQQNALKEHTFTHNANKPSFKCPICPATSLRRRDLRVHTRKFHCSEEPLLCKKCGTTIPDRYHLNEHMKKHMVKYLICSICSYSCNNERRMEEHALIHKGSTPFACDVCDRKFRTKQHLKRHQNMNHNPGFKLKTKLKIYTCSQCDKTFSRKGYLQRHINFHIIAAKSDLLISKTRIQNVKSSPRISSRPKKRLQRCGTCPGCKTKNCGECVKCLDMVVFGGLGGLKQRCNLRICSNLYYRNDNSQEQETRTITKEEIQSEQKLGGNLYEQQNQERMEIYGRPEVVEEEELSEQQITEETVVTEDLEAGEIGSYKQQMVTEDLETGEIVDVDEKTLILLLQNQE